MWALRGELTGISNEDVEDRECRHSEYLAKGRPYGDFGVGRCKFNFAGSDCEIIGGILLLERGGRLFTAESRYQVRRNFDERNGKMGQKQMTDNME